MSETVLTQAQQPAMQRSTETKMRRCESCDIDEIVSVCARELPKLPNYEGVRVDEDRLRFVITNNLNNESALILILVNSENRPVGGCMGVIAPLVFSWDTVATDIFFYVSPEYRTLRNFMMLGKGYRDWAIARKATLITLTHRSGYRPESLGKLCESLGFEYVGAVYHWRDKRGERK